jgi:hypothetical protein
MQIEQPALIAQKGVNKYQSNSVEEPAHLLCPITWEIFRDPVFLAESGNTYEREAIETYFADRCLNSPKDPLTNLPLSSTAKYINWDKRREVYEFLDRFPSYTPEGWKSRKVVHLSQTKSLEINQKQLKFYHAQNIQGGLHLNRLQQHRVWVREVILVSFQVGYFINLNAKCPALTGFLYALSAFGMLVQLFSFLSMFAVGLTVRKHY